MGAAHSAVAMKSSLLKLGRLLGCLFALGLASTLVRAADAAPAAAATPAAPAATPPTPKDSEIIQSVGAYFQNTDPAAPFASYKDKDGNFPKGFSAPTLGVAGPRP